MDWVWMSHRAPSLILSLFAIRKIDSVKLIFRDFPYNLSCSILFFPLIFCFFVLRPLQIVLVTWSCGASRREIMRFGGGRVWGISAEAPCFVLCSSLSDLSGIKENQNCTAFSKWEVVSLKVLSGGIFHSSPVLTAGWVKIWYRCAWLVYLSGVILLGSFFQLRCCHEQS